MTDIEKLRELLAAATPGPWKHIPGKRMVFVVAPECHVYSNRDNDDGEGPYHPNTIKRWNADAALIVAAVNALPAMCNEIDALRADRDRMREALSIFVKCSYPADTSIDPRGYGWCEAWLDEALPIARAALGETK